MIKLFYSKVGAEERKQKNLPKTEQEKLKTQLIIPKKSQKSEQVQQISQQLPNLKPVQRPQVEQIGRAHV